MPTLSNIFRYLFGLSEEAPSVGCRYPTSEEDPELYFLGCCHEHLTVCRPVKSGLDDSQTSLTSCSPSSSQSDIQPNQDTYFEPTHPWIPVCLSYNHLACLVKNGLQDEKDPQMIMSLSAEDYLWRREHARQIDADHLWSHDLYYIKGQFIQAQTSTIRFSYRLTGYDEKFQNCPHTSFTLVGLRPAHSTSKPEGRIYGLAGPRPFADLERDNKFYITCGICATEATCVVKLASKWEASIEYDCLRRLGGGVDFATDRVLQRLMTPGKALVLSQPDNSLMEILSQAEKEGLVAYEWNNEDPSKLSEGVRLDRDWLIAEQDLDNERGRREAEAQHTQAEMIGMMGTLSLGLKLLAKTL